MDPHHRKIDLQSPADLLYLRDNIRKSAQEKIDLHIPLSAAPKDGEDEFRRRVEELVHQYINETLNMALPSLSINGLDASPGILAPPTPINPAAVDPDDPTYEPYDPRLAQRLRELHAAVEAETTRAAELRREAPPAAAEAYLERLRAELAEQDAEWIRTRAGTLAAADGGLAGWKLERPDETKESWRRATAELEGLRSVPRDFERLERARRAAEEIGGT